MKTIGRALLAGSLAASCQAEPKLAPDPARETGAEDAPAVAASPPGAAAAQRVPDVLYVPTPEPVVDRMLELAHVGPNDVVYDLGCGDGRIVAAAAARHGAHAIGYDIDPVRVAEARHTIARYGVERLVQIEQRDIFTLDLSAASVVTLYLLPELNVRLLPQLERMKPGTRIISHDFDIAGVTPAKVERLDVDGKAHTIYYFELPLKKEPDPRVP
ncbi:MAG TPA: methyltransferase domain-containing protein [Polyangiaceae bacterium]|nr:methyltransferase domain-containing protein [Polyangiaceae bacterium]